VDSGPADVVDAVVYRLFRPLPPQGDGGRRTADNLHIDGGCDRCPRRPMADGGDSSTSSGGPCRATAVGETGPSSQ
jgi:hypothetical protein